MSRVFIITVSDEAAETIAFNAEHFNAMSVTDSGSAYEIEDIAEVDFDDEGNIIER